ncbi:DUF2441 domain-containing protein [Salinimicrobium soli]|uniref:DUF2441 domain-containing protein n=1 Tax=Salinimicrobium soli TaxID=1254399 RepID=UPI003AAC8FAC
MHYYHIQKIKGENEWSVDQILDTNFNKNNPFIDELLSGLNYNYLKKIGDEDISSYTEKRLRENNCYQDFENFEDQNKQKHFQLLENCSEFEDLAYKLVKLNRQYLKWIREEVFEKVRLQIDSNLPSRKRGLWICRKEELPKWWDILESPKKKIFEVKLLNGKKMETDEHYCELKNLSIEEFEENARLYWKGKFTDEPIKEILFEGKFQVVGVYESLEELKIQGVRKS